MVDRWEQAVGTVVARKEAAGERMVDRLATVAGTAVARKELAAASMAGRAAPAVPLMHPFDWMDR
jgi:hypothetical protein